MDCDSSTNGTVTADPDVAGPGVRFRSLEIFPAPSKKAYRFLHRSLSVRLSWC